MGKERRREPYPYSYQKTTHSLTYSLMILFREILGHLLLTAKSVAKEQGLTDGYR